jgi:hypothetical protein
MGHLSPIAVLSAEYKGSRSIRGAVGAVIFLSGGGSGFDGRVGVAVCCCRAAPLMVAMMVVGGELWREVDARDAQNALEPATRLIGSDQARMR